MDLGELLLIAGLLVFFLGLPFCDFWPKARARAGAAMADLGRALGAAIGMEPEEDWDRARVDRSPLAAKKADDDDGDIGDEDSFVLGEPRVPRGELPGEIFGLACRQLPARSRPDGTGMTLSLLLPLLFLPLCFFSSSKS